MVIICTGADRGLEDSPSPQALTASLKDAAGLQPPQPAERTLGDVSGEGGSPVPDPMTLGLLWSTETRERERETETGQGGREERRSLAHPLGSWSADCCGLRPPWPPQRGSTGLLNQHVSGAQPPRVPVPLAARMPSTQPLSDALALLAAPLGLHPIPSLPLPSGGWPPTSTFQRRRQAQRGDAARPGRAGHGLGRAESAPQHPRSPGWDTHHP